MISSVNETIGIILTCVALIHVSIAWMISMLVIIIIIYHAHHNRLKSEEKITLTLSANIYLAIFMHTMTMSVINIETLLGDPDSQNFYSSWCIFKGYWAAVSGYAMYQAFVLEAAFRLCRIVYPNYRWLRSYLIFVINTPIQIALGSVLVCPVLVWHAIIYISNNQYCFVLLTKPRDILWILSICYLFPYTCLLMIYIRITLFLRQQASSLVPEIQRRRQQRDLLAIRRIYVIVTLLFTIAVPEVVVLVISLVTGMEHPLSHRIIWLGSEISIAVLSIVMIFKTPQLKNIVVRRWRRNRVMNIEGPIEMRPAAIAQ